MGQEDIEQALPLPDRVPSQHRVLAAAQTNGVKQEIPLPAPKIQVTFSDGTSTPGKARSTRSKASEETKNRRPGIIHRNPRTINAQESANQPGKGKSTVSPTIE